MKQKWLYLLFFFISLYTMVIVRANTLSLLGKVIYLDPGHGGKDPGALYGGIEEADINLELCLKIQEKLERNGAIVYLTRYGNYDLSVKNAIQRKRSDLSRRANMINKSGADLYFSVHLNADSSTTWRGAQVFYDNVLSENEKIAKWMQNILKDKLKTNRQYKQLTDQYMYRRIKVPGVLLEVGFLSNPNERYLLKQTNYQDKIAQAITDGIIGYLTSQEQ